MLRRNTQATTAGEAKPSRQYWKRRRGRYNHDTQPTGNKHGMQGSLER